MNSSGKMAIAFLLLVAGVLALVTALARIRREPSVAPTQINVFVNWPQILERLSGQQ